MDIQPPKPPILTTPEPQHQEWVVTSGAPRYSVLDRHTNKVTFMSSLQIPTETEREFYSLSERWRRETAHLSVASQQASNFDYQQIIGMGKEALPLIFRELPETTSDWFWALAAIARDKAPTIPADAEGDVDKIAAIWFQWGIDNGYVTR